MHADLAIRLQKVAILGGTFIAGAYFGWVITKKNAVALAEKEIAEAKVFYQNLYEKKAEEEEAATKPPLEQLVLDLGYVEDVAPGTPITKINYAKAGTFVLPEGEVVVLPPHTVEAPEPELEWDYEYETGNRVPEIPYNLHRDEWDMPTSNSKVSFAYYEDDDVLVDDGDSIIGDKYMLIGEDTLRFGHGTGDPHIAFVRNELLSMDFEITLVRDSYSRAVLGLEPEPELRHSYQRRSRRSREFD